MTGRERQLAAIRHELPDRIPVDWICIENAADAHFQNASSHDFFRVRIVDLSKAVGFFNIGGAVVHAAHQNLQILLAGFRFHVGDILLHFLRLLFLPARFLDVHDCFRKGYGGLFHLLFDGLRP